MCNRDHMWPGESKICLTLYRTSLLNPALNVFTIANIQLFKIQSNGEAK